MLAAAALFSSGGAVIKAVHLAGWQVASFRVGRRRRGPLRADAGGRRRRPTLKVLAVGVAYAATLILFVLANKLTTSASAIYLQSTAPLYVLLLSPWLLREQIRGRDAAFMAVLAAGLGLFFVGFDPVSATAPGLEKLGNPPGDRLRAHLGTDGDGVAAARPGGRGVGAGLGVLGERLRGAPLPPPGAAAGGVPPHGLGAESLLL